MISGNLESSKAADDEYLASVQVYKALWSIHGLDQVLDLLRHLTRGRFKSNG
jgi:hypothetical protein